MAIETCQMWWRKTNLLISTRYSQIKKLCHRRPGCCLQTVTRSVIIDVGNCIVAHFSTPIVAVCWWWNGWRARFPPCSCGSPFGRRIFFSIVVFWLEAQSNICKLVFLSNENDNLLYINISYVSSIFQLHFGIGQSWDCMTCITWFFYRFLYFVQCG